MIRVFRQWLPTLALTLVLLFGLWLHQWQIGNVPLGLYSDEASIGLNASMIERFQTDEFGTPWPLFFQAFGEYKNPVYIYTSAALLHFLPLSDVALRGVSFLFFGAALTMWAVFALRVFASPWTAVWTTAALATVPWVFTLSRVSFEAISYVLLYISLLYCIHRWFIQRKPRFWMGLLLGVIAGIAWYTYSTARLLVPLLILNLAMVSLRRGTWRAWIGLALGGILLALPAILLLVYHPEVLLGRFESLTYINDPSLSPGDMVWQFVQNYGSYFSPDYQLFHGDPNLRHHTGVGGMVYYCLYMLLWIGVARYVVQVVRGKAKRTSLPTFMFIELFLAPVAASLTEADHTIRVITMIVPILYFTGFGIEWIRFRTSSVLYGVSILLASIVLVIEARTFLIHATTVYPYVSARSFYTFGLEKAVRNVAESGNTLLLVDPALVDALVVSNYYSLTSGNAVYVTTLPERYIESALNLPHCVLNKKKPYQPEAVAQHGKELPLDVRSTLSLVCYPAA